MLEKKKILYCASTASHLRNFHLPYMQQLQQMGYRITACVNQYDALPFTDEVAVVPFHKKITSPENIKNIIRVYRLLKQQQFHAISVHTTLAAAVVRAAVLLLPKQQRPKVFYTCHGYLFNEKGGLGKWKYLLPEKICAGATNVLMVMNQEDERIARKQKLYKDNLIFIPGMGVDFTRFDLRQDKAELRQQYEISEEDVLFVFAGEFSHRKNQQELIRAFARAVKQMPNAKLVLAGDGALLDTCKQSVEEMNLQEKIIFAGHVNNMPELYRVCDICVSASRIEGLPFNIMEAMYCELPCAASSIKGHADLLQHGQNGYLYESEAELAEYMVRLYQNTQLRHQMGVQAKQNVSPYALDIVQPVVMQVYEENL